MTTLTAPAARGGALAADGAAVALLALLAALALSTVRFGDPLREDAAMLLRYADHVAAGSGLVWNVGEAPVDGATDTLFAVVVALVRAFGAAGPDALRGVVVASWLLTAAVVYLTARLVHRGGPAVAALCTLPVVVGPARFYITDGFGAPFFGLWVATTAALAMLLCTRPNRTVSLLLGVSALLLGATRPEGVLLAVFLAVAVLIRLGVARGVRALATGAGVFVVVGAAYLAWRWSYFGYPLPNPYYRKGGGTLHPDGLLSSIKGSTLLAMPFAVLWIPALLDRRYRRAALAWAFPIVAFALSWVLLSSEMNQAYRFQYPVLVLIAIAWPSLTGALRELASRVDGRRAAAGVLAAGVLAATAFVLLTADYRSSAGVDERDRIGRLMAPYADRGYAVATTEAGLVPLESGWRALDTWGLNDAVIAHRGRLDPTDLDRADPTVVIVHQPYPRGAPPVPDPGLGPRWTDMTVTLNRWLDTHRYRLVRATADRDRAGSTWNLWVADRTDTADLSRALACDTYPGEPDVVPTAAGSSPCGDDRAVSRTSPSSATGPAPG